jgi:hypothetical protein
LSPPLPLLNPPLQGRKANQAAVAFSCEVADF